jgi:release factor glutamine methyltransferase
MFVKDNSIKSLKHYMTERLSTQFSNSEIKIVISYALEKRLGLSQRQQIGIDSDTVSESDLLYFRSVVKRLQANEPLAFVIGETDFDGLSILCSSAALIPRPETVELVELICNEVKGKDQLSILDVCTGTGCIAFALEQRLNNSTIIATEYSTDALSLAEKNKANLNSKVQIIAKNALVTEGYDFIADDSLDIVVSNPPYITEGERNEMFDNVLAHEPHMALFVTNNDPMQFYQAIALSCLPKLKNKGLIAFEINEHFGDETKKVLENIGYKDIRICKDLQGKNRMIIAHKL